MRPEPLERLCNVAQLSCIDFDASGIQDLRTPAVYCQIGPFVGRLPAEASMFHRRESNRRHVFANCMFPNWRRSSTTFLPTITPSRYQFSAGRSPLRILILNLGSCRLRSQPSPVLEMYLRRYVTRRPGAGLIASIQAYLPLFLTTPRLFG